MLTRNRSDKKPLEKPMPVAQVRWDPLTLSDNPSAALPTPLPGMDVIQRLNAFSGYIRYAWFILIGVMLLPHLVFTIFFGTGGLGALMPAILMTLAIGALAVLGGRIASARLRETLEKARAPAMRGPVADTAERLSMTPLGVMSSDRVDALALRLGDVHAALGVSDPGTAYRPEEAPDEFGGQMPDSTPFWCMMKKNELPLQGVPEQYRHGRSAGGDDRATAFTMLVAFPLSRKTGFRLEILHRVIQVRFARMARTIDTGSAEFNNRFLVATKDQGQDLTIHRAITPALQTLLIELFDRFWLVNVVIDDDTVFVSAVDFRTAENASMPVARWMERGLSEFLKVATRIRNFID